MARVCEGIGEGMRYHTPVLLKEAIDALAVEPGKKYIDATVGGGGHARAISAKGAEVLGIDRDPEAIAEAKKTLQIPLVAGNFADIEGIAKKHGFGAVDGVLFDLGVSSHQLDTPERGFSYRFEDEPLDLRLDRAVGETAADLVNRSSEDELYEIIATYGEEELARSIAHGILRARRVNPIVTVGDLKKIVGGEPARLSRVFQALRIAVNDELGSLKRGLTGAHHVLVPKGRLVVISFHSLEDRIVKQFLRTGGWRLITTKPVTADRDEVMRNSRSRSAKMRVAQKII